MRILVIGGGGREHALIWKLSQSPHTKRLYCAPGNAGIADRAECINLKPTDLDGLANFASNEKVDLTVVGPEAPLIAGVVDRFEARGLPIFGPATDPSRLEGSKAFAKELMVKYGIPTGEYRRCESADEAHAAVRDHFRRHGAGSGVVIKADGIAAGKGVCVVDTEEQALSEVDRMMVQRAFGEAGDVVVVEERLVGQELSLMAITDGETVIPMLPAQDHKRIFDNDGGPNTGGMGAYTPVSFATPELIQQAVDQVLKPAVSAIRDLGIPYKGVLYAGLMVTADGLKTLEFNCRFGDPETQAILPLLDTDLVELLMSAVNCALDTQAVKWKREAAVCVVAASGGYPGDYVCGKLIEGLDKAQQSEGCTVFHAGTRLEHGQAVTDGGRVLAVTGVGADLLEAAARAYSGLGHIKFEGMHARTDIGRRAAGH